MWRPRSPWRYLLVTSAVLCPLQRGNVYADPRTPGRRKGVETLSQGSEESTPRGACISWVLVVRWRSLHRDCRDVRGPAATSPARSVARQTTALRRHRSEEHTSELQSPDHLVCRLLLEKKKNKSQLLQEYSESQV